MVCPILVGRDEALAAIRTALRAGRNAPVLRVYGEAGIGKSRLVAQALRSLPDRRVLRTASFEADRLLPLAPFLELLKEPSVAGEPLLARIGGLARQGERRSSGDPELLRRELFDELANVVLDGDTLLVVEDLHWSDEASLDALMHLARRAGARTRLLVTYRDDEMSPALESFLASLDRARLAMDVPLRRLGRGEVASMTEATTGTRPGRRLLDLLLEVTDGNPFFVEEVLGALSNELPTGGASGEVPIPRSVQDAVRRRFDRLGPVAARLAHVAAAIGRRFDFDLIPDLLALSEAALLDAVHELVNSQLAVQTPGGTIEFRHELTRRAIYDRLIGWERRRLHLDIAEAIERKAADLDAYAGDLARHYQLAGEWERSLTWAEQAGRRAYALYSPRTAVEHFDRALEASQRLARDPSSDLLRARARAHEMIGDLEAAIADHETVLEAARAASDLRLEWESLLALGALWISREWARAEKYLDEALSLARRIDDPVALGRTLNRKGNLFMIRGDVQEARRLHEEALVIFENLEAPHDLASTLDLVAVTTLYSGDLFAARDHYERVEEAFRALDDRPAVANALTMRALCGGAYFVHTFVPALDSRTSIALAEESLRIAREIGWHGESFVLLNLTTVLAEAGRLGDALETASEALALAEEMEHLPWMVLSRFNRGMALLDVLAAEEAVAELDVAVTLGKSFQEGVFLAASLAGRARAEATLGRVDDAATSATMAQEVDASLLTTRAVLHARTELHLAAGRPDKALSIADELLATAPRSGEGPPSPVIAGLRGEALLALERMDEAEDAFRSASKVARALGKPVAEWRALAGLARAQERASRAADAEKSVRTATEVIDRVAASLPPERAGTFRNGALSRVPGYERRAQDAERFAGLTPRQRQVAALIAHGLTNNEIAEKLVISPLTAETHVKHILTKLGFTSRTQIAAWAIDKGLGGRDQETERRL